MEERDTIRDSKIVAERCMDVLKIGRANLDGACRRESDMIFELQNLIIKSIEARYNDMTFDH